MGLKSLFGGNRNLSGSQFGSIAAQHSDNAGPFGPGASHQASHDSWNVRINNSPFSKNEAHPTAWAPPIKG